MKSCVLHSAKDLRIEETSVGQVGANDVRVRIGAGGICGSDLHYYFHGRVGDIVLRQPMVLGHEVAGTVTETGEHVTHVREGDLVALDPARTCGTCEYCTAGRESLCQNVLYFGSAMRMPHVQGAFQEEIIVEGRQCVKFDDDVGMDIAAFAEPLSVALHAVNRAERVLDSNVLITGCGPIGALIVLAARKAGAANIVVSDVAAQPLKTALEIGADEAINVAEVAKEMAKFEEANGFFDVAIEASGNLMALGTCLRCLRPGGRLVQVGLLAHQDVNANLNKIVTKELEIVGAFRADREFRDAVQFLSDGSIDVSKVLSHSFPLTEADKAFEVAIDRTQSMKVQLNF